MSYSTGVDTNDMRWIKDPKRLKCALEEVVEKYEPLAPETLKYYIQVAGENVLTSSNTPLGVECGRREILQGADLDGLEMEFNPKGFKFPLSFIYTYEEMARACSRNHQLLLEYGMVKKELLACVIPPYQTNVPLAAIKEIHNRLSGGKYQGEADMKYFIAIFPNDYFDRESVRISTRSGEAGPCKFFSMEIGEPLPYDILAIGKALFE